MFRSISLGAIAFVLAGFGMISSASAQELGYCGTQTCDCEEVASGYDDCQSFDPANFVDVSDPLAVRDAFNIDSSYNANTHTWYVHAETTTARTHVLPIHPNRGEWSSLQELSDYINAAFGTEIDFADEQVQLMIEFDGAYGRYDTLQGQWAPTQSRNLFEDLASGPDGTLDVDGEDLAAGIDPNCLYGKSDGDLKASQCSEVGQRPAYLDGGSIAFDAFAETMVFDVVWKTQVGAVRVGNGSAVWLPVKADTIVVATEFFDSSATKINEKPCEDTKVSKETCSDYADGVCSDSLTERGIFDVEISTWAGSVPSGCEYN